MNAYATKRPVDLPMKATVERWAKGKYCVTLKFKSGRIYDEMVFRVASVKLAREAATRLYPSIKWSKKK